MPTPPRLLVFDLDGTLIDSSLDLCHSVNAALAHAGRPTLPNEIIASHIGDGAAMLIQRSLGLPESFVDLADPTFATTYGFFLSFYRAHKLDNTRAYPGVFEALTEIRARYPHLPMAVLTNKPVRPSREICTALGLAPFFFQNYGGNSFASKKPDPRGLLTLIAEADSLLAARDSNEPPLQPAHIVMIGDSDVDILTARAIGAQTLGCLYGLSPESLAAANPDVTVDHASQWPTALGL